MKSPSLNIVIWRFLPQAEGFKLRNQCNFIGWKYQSCTNGNYYHIISKALIYQAKVLGYTKLHLYLDYLDCWWKIQLLSFTYFTFLSQIVLKIWVGWARHGTGNGMLWTKFNGLSIPVDTWFLLLHNQTAVSEQVILECCSSCMIMGSMQSSWPHISTHWWILKCDKAEGPSQVQFTCL